MNVEIPQLPIFVPSVGHGFHKMGIFDFRSKTLSASEAALTGIHSLCKI